MTHVFISHSSQDNETAKEIVGWLRDRNFESIFLDFDPELGIPAGRHWEQELYQRLRVCRAVIILCSKHSTASQWCFAEITQASSLGKDLFPIKIGPCVVPEVLIDRQVIDLTKNPEEGYQRLWNGLIRSGLDPKDYFPWDPKRPPYPGLLAFEEEDAAVFFGRDESIQDGLDKLNQLRRYHRVQRLLMFLGASGSGKSSLVRAGIVPRLRRDPDAWLVVNAFRPRQQPFAELGIALSEAFSRYGQPQDRMIEELLIQAANDRPADGNILVQLAWDLGMAADKRNATIVLVIDQFEELLGAGENSQNERFLRFLRHALEVPHENPLAVLGTLRSDFLGDFQNHPTLLGMRFEQSLVGPLTVDGYVKVIEGPAEVAGLKLKSGLTQLMVKDTEGQDTLPLLAFTLRELWEQYGRLDGDLSIEEYHRLGGLLGSVQRAADGVMKAEELSEGQINDLRQAFLAMTRINEEGQYARRAVHWDDLPPASHPILQRFVEARLLVSGKEDGTLEIAHETLLRNWPLLKGWLDESRELLLWRQRLQTHYSEFELSGTLLRGAPLTEAERWMVERPRDLSPAQVVFIRESLEMREQERIAGERRRKRIISGLGIGLGLALILVVLAGWQWWEADKQRERAEAQKQEAEVQRRTALSRQLAVQAVSLSSQGFLERALLLSQEALRVSETIEARGALLMALQYSPRLTTFLRGRSATSLPPQQQVAALIQSPLQVISIAFSPDGKMLASGGNDGRVILWDPQRRQQMGEPLRGHDGPVVSVAFSPDGRILASAGEDGSVILWDPQRRQQMGEPLRGHDGPVFCVAFSPDGRILASGSRDNTIILWDPQRRQQMGEPLRGDDGQVVTSIAFSLDGRMLASGGLDSTEDDGTVILWDTQRRQQMGEPLRGDGGPLNSIAFSPDSRILASAGEDGSVILWDPQRRQPMGEPLRGHDGWVHSLAFSPDGRILASAGQDGSVILWDPQSRQQMGEPLGVHGDGVSEIVGLLGDKASSIAFNPDGETLASKGDGSIILWDPQRRQQMGEPLRGHDGQVFSVAFSPDGRILASAGEDGSVILWDPQRRQQMGEPLRGHDGPVVSVAFSPDGRILASSGEDGSVILWDPQRRQQMGEPLRGHDGPVFSVAFSPDGRILASGSRDNTIILWDPQTRQPMGEPLRRHDGWVHSLAFSPDGRILASGSSDSTVILWDPQSRQQMGEPLRGDGGPLNSIAFSPDSRILASGGARVILWDTQTRQPMGEPLRGWDSWMNSVAFSPDGRILASVDNYGVVILWDMEIESWKERACRVANRSLTLSEWVQYLGNEPYHKTCPNVPERP